MGCLTEIPKTGGDDGFIGLIFRVKPWLWKEVASDVFGDELVVGNVRIERAYDVIAVVVGVVNWIVKFVAMTFSIAHEVEPVTTPAFAKMRGVKKTIYG